MGIEGMKVSTGMAMRVVPHFFILLYTIYLMGVGLRLGWLIENLSIVQKKTFRDDSAVMVILIEA